MIAKTTLKSMTLETAVPRDCLDRSFNRSGLCAYCERKFSCALSGDFGLVYDCEDYEAGEGEVPVITFSALRLSEDKEEDELSGLCHNCQRRDICQLKNINGGVWHCVEFI